MVFLPKKATFIPRAVVRSCLLVRTVNAVYEGVLYWPYFLSIVPRLPPNK
jgi:hypothetical protein